MQTHAQRLIKIRSNHFLQLTSPCQHDSGERFVLTEGWHHELLCGCGEGIWKITRNSISLLSKEEGLTYIFRGAVTRILDILEKTDTFPTHM